MLCNQELGGLAEELSAAYRFDLCQFCYLNLGILGLAPGTLHATSCLL